jgi:hypothetical protein
MPRPNHLNKSLVGLIAFAIPGIELGLDLANPTNACGAGALCAPRLARR